jgi:hypothetical protein
MYQLASVEREKRPYVYVYLYLDVDKDTRLSQFCEIQIGSRERSAVGWISSSDIRLEQPSKLGAI